MKVGVALVVLVLTLTGAPWSATATSPEAHSARVSDLSVPVSVRLGDNFARKLGDTPRSFRKAVRAELMTMWKHLGFKTSCRRASVVTIREFRRSGFAYSEMGTSAKCGGGGGTQFFVRRRGEWRTPSVLGGQESPTCSNLLRFHVPRMMGATECYNDHGIPVWYDPAADRAIDWNSDALQPGEEFCGSYQASASRTHLVYATAGYCGSIAVLREHFLSPPPGWMCEGFQNGLTGCNYGPEATVGRSVMYPYLRAVQPGGWVTLRTA